MKLSVFGATGFIGSQFCKQSTHECIAVPREQRKPPTDDVLYLLSTVHNYYPLDNDYHKDIDTNLSILVDVLYEWGLKIGHNPRGVFGFCSSWFVYGDGAPLPVNERSHCRPKGFYAVTKLAAEQLLKSFCVMHGLRYRIFRLANVFGPGDKAGPKKNALQYLIEKLRRGEDIELYHDGNFYRDYIHVRDVVRAIDLCLDTAPTNWTVNIGSGEKIHFGRLIRMAADLLQSESAIRGTEPPTFHLAVQVRDFVMDTQRLRGLGFKPLITIEEGIRELCQTGLD